MPHESILAHLAPLLTNQIENVATDALAHLLLQYLFLADAFREFVSSAGVDLPDNLAFNTQSRGLDTAIPDLVGIDTEGRYILIIESKFWAPLTPNQPGTYIKRLPPDRPAILLFVAPASRQLTLWPELLNGCSSLTSQPDARAGSFLTVRLNSRHLLALTSWEAILAALYDKANQERDEFAAGDVWQLQSLCTKVDAEAFHPLSEDEITAPTGKRKVQLRGLLDDLVRQLAEKGIISTEGYRATPGPRSYKRYMSIRGLPNSDWCLEYNEELQKHSPATVLWLSATETPQSSEIFARGAVEHLHIRKQYLIPLEIPINVEREAILSSLYSQVIAIVSKPGFSGLPHDPQRS